MFLVVTSAALLIMTALATTNQRSKPLLVALKRAVHSGVPAVEGGVEYAAVMRGAEALRELRIQMGSVFYFDKALVLTVIEAMFLQSANLLLMN